MDLSLEKLKLKEKTLSSCLCAPENKVEILLVILWFWEIQSP
jgi:hypothetical protein